MSSQQETEARLLDLFGPERGHAAIGIYRCLIRGDKLPKNEFAGVRVEDVHGVVASIEQKDVA